MDKPFDELSKPPEESVSLRTPRRKIGLILAALIGLAVPTASRTDAQTSTITDLGPLILISIPDPLVGRSTGHSPLVGATSDTEVQPYVAVNPANANNMVALWIGHNFRDNVAGVTFDGGTTWQTVALPGITRPVGGTYHHSADPWLSFAPNGDLYATSTGWGPAPYATFVSKSGDGGLTWNTSVPASAASTDKPSVTADPANAKYAYTVWTGFTATGATIQFSRTTDGGQTWESGHSILDLPGSDIAYGMQIEALPDGTLVCIFTHMIPTTVVNKTQVYDCVLSVLRSSDHGQSWSAPVPIVEQQPLIDTTKGSGSVPLNGLITDPDTGHIVEAHPMFPSVAVDHGNGNLYAVWIDARFSGGKYNSIAFSQSTDGGLTWSAPIQVNQTPRNIPALNRQAWNPSVAVASDGTIGVSYYDFRFNDTNPGCLTDYWLVSCHPTSLKSPTHPTNWDNETRLTDASFDLEQAPTRFNGAYFLGDNEGLTAVGRGFAAVWTQPYGGSPDHILFRRVEP